jgi:putative spermidine/putrescine transport system permease protein
MTDFSATGPMMAADGRPLKASLNRALRRQKLRALLLIAPLLIFIMISFVAPIVDMLFRSVENQMVRETVPRTVAALEGWDPVAGDPPSEDVFASLYTDLVLAEEYKAHTRLGTRLNYEFGGASSLLRGTGRAVGRFPTDIYTEQFGFADPSFEDGAVWAEWMADPSIREVLPLTADAYDAWALMTTEVKNDLPAEEQPADFVYTALYRDLANGALPAGMPVVAVDGWDSVAIRDLFLEDDAGWGEPEIWRAIKAYGSDYTAGYFLNAIDLQIGPEGIERRPEDERIYITLFFRTIILSVTITATCIILGYPIAWLLANLPARTANLLMILVLLPFWTSLLVRTSAWKVLLQQQGVINDLLVWVGLVDDANRLVMINNQTGTIIAMTHILLPFMILPLYSVMKTIPPSYLRAAKSLGATNWTAFWRVYFPQSVPGIGAGSILVFILAIGYYITPELVGGNKGVFISNRIAYHIGTSLNWGLAAALGTILLVLVLVLYWVYDRVVGIDNVKLGG